MVVCNRRFGTSIVHIVKGQAFQVLTLEDGTDRSSETSFISYHSTPRKFQEERRTTLSHGGSLKPRKAPRCIAS
jgi:hypothetical protein